MKKKKKIPNKKTVTNDEIKAYPTRRTVLPFRSGESTSEAHRTRSRSRRPRGGGRRRRVEEEEEVPPGGGLLLLLLRRVVVVAVSSRIVRFLFIESVSGVLFYFYFFSPKP